MVTLKYKGQTIGGGSGGGVEFDWWSPHMTSNTEPAPYVASGNNTTTYYPFLAFDGLSTTGFGSQNGDSYLSFDFGKRTIVGGIRMLSNEAIGYFPKEFILSGSDDGDTWHEFYSADGSEYETVEVDKFYEYRFDVVNYRYYKLSSSNRIYVAEIEFYKKVEPSFWINDDNGHLYQRTSESVDLGRVVGSRGTGLLHITTAPSTYTTETNGVIPSYRIPLETVKEESGIDNVIIGDIIEINYWHLPVILVTDSYVYTGNRYSIQGPKGDPGTTGQAEEIYSTNETKIGKWINGKPLYRKCLSFSNAINGNTQVYVFPTMLDFAIITGYLVSTNGQTLPIPISLSSSLWAYAKLNSDSKTISIDASSSGGSGVLIVEYTKSFDTATASITPTDLQLESATLNTQAGPTSMPSASLDISTTEDEKV